MQRIGKRHDRFRTRNVLPGQNDQPTAWDEQYVRLSVTFDTGDARYNWLNKSLFVAAGRLLGTDGSNMPFTGLPGEDCQSTLQWPRV